jgi:CheY-like chemotaxis protein
VATPAGVSELSGIRLLVVDDDADLLDSMCDVLESYGAVCTKAASGSAGFDAFLHARPDALISDLWMPGGDGFDMIARIRAMPLDEGGLTPAIAISAAENAKSAIMSGFHAFMPKPFDIEKLVGIVHDFVRTTDDAQTVAPWTVTKPAAGKLTLTFAGAMRAADMRRMLPAFLMQLEEEPCDVVMDMRRLGEFSPSVASIAERSGWRLRHRAKSCRIVGGSFLARLTVVATCKLLGIPYVLAEEL